MNNTIELTRFHIGLKQGRGLTITVTDGAQRRIFKELMKAGDGSFYQFDYSTQECVIYKEVKS